MGKRILVAVIWIPLLLIALFVVYPVFPPMLPILFAAVSVIAVHEALWSTGFLKHPRISVYALIMAGLIPFWAFYGTGVLPALCGLFVYVVLLFAEAIASHKQVTLEKMGGTFFLSLVIPFFLSAFLRLGQMEQWRGYVALPLVVAFISDAFALFAGMLFGRHKLAPELSPKKTVEGAVGGFLGAIVCTLLYGVLLQFVFGFQVRYLPLALYGALGSVVSQLGDLSFSYIKREYGIKDFGKIFPGHGGVLDRFDSVIFCAPLIELMVRILPTLG